MERATPTNEELAEEAEEIALTDLVFSHRDEAAGELEDGAGEVPEGKSQEAAVTIAEPLTDIAERPGNGAELKTTAAVAEPEPSDAGLPSAEPIALDDYEVLAIQEGLTGIDEPVLDAIAAEEIAGAEEIGAEEERPEEESHSASTSAPGPSASLREQGGRSLHRVSRRMRRRRGGSRFPAQGQESGNGGATIAPDVRTEMHREQLEDKAVERAERTYPSISDLLKPGQEIIVQIAKEPLGQKGARITSHIALPGRYVVFMPSVSHLGVSRKVGSEEERQRLKRILQAHRPGTTGGFIVRTAGEGVPEEEIAADMSFLYNLWLDIRQKAEKKPAPALLHYDLDIVQRILRDQVTSEFKAIWVDNEELYENVVTFMQRFQPALVNRVKMYTRPTPIFDAFNITQELEKALRPKVWLKSGGYIVINQTEALVAIDINTGKYVGKSNRLEDTIVKTNTEAVREIVRQIRLRDLGGIIVVDFIDMDERKNRQKVMQTLEEAMRADKAPYKILQFNDFGLVAITRKRVKQSLERTLCAPCPYCEGAGYVKSVQTVISEILVEAQKIARAIEGKDVVLRVHPDVAKVLKANDNHYLEELEEILGRPVLVAGDATLHHQKFDLG
jgi:ribonuclease G